MSQKIAGSDRYVTLQKRAEDLVISPRLELYESDDLTPVDPITYEVIAHKLTQLTGELGATLQRVSGSVIVTEAHDFNVSLGDERGSLFNVGDYATTHGTASQNVIRWTLENRSENPGIEEGDMFLSNDPWIGSVHQPDTSLLVPIFVEGKLFCWATNTMHLLDTGGQYPGGLNTAAEDVFAESMPLPPIKLVRKGELQVDVEDMFLRRSRLPKLVALDLRAMIAANNVATTRIRELVEAYGAATLHRVIKQLLSTSEQLLRDRLRELPDGTWKDVQLYEVANASDRGVYAIRTTMTKQDDRLTFDFTETDDQKGFFNSTWSSTQGGVISALMPLLCPDLPWVPGAITRVVDFEFRTGSIVSAEFPAAVSAGPISGGLAGTTAATTLLSKMLSAGDARYKRNIIAASTPAIPVVIFSGEGHDGEYMVASNVDVVAGGFGARAWRDGDEVAGFMMSPACRIPNIEHQEQSYPIMYLYRREAVDSGGAGKFRGGAGGESAVIPLEGKSISFMLGSHGMAFPAGAGLAGGQPAKSVTYRVLRDADMRARLPLGDLPGSVDAIGGDIEWPHAKAAGLEIGSTDVFTVNWAGGGGFGDPLERDPEAVAHDVRELYVTLDQARRVYGVVLDRGAVVADATRRLREELRGSRIGTGPLAEPAASTLPDSAVWLDDHLHVSTDGSVGCARCGHKLSRGLESYKTGAVTRDVDLVEGGLAWIDPAHYIDDAVIMREFACPGCGVALASEVTRPGTAVIDDMVLHRSVFVPVDDVEIDDAVLEAAVFDA